MAAGKSFSWHHRCVTPLYRIALLGKRTHDFNRYKPVTLQPGFNFRFMRDINSTHQPVILFDGVCNLCSNVVQFVIKRDHKNQFRFASLQSHFGKELLEKSALSYPDFTSFILYKNGNIYTKSSGALLVAKQLSGAWPLLYIFILVPPFIRNWVYDLVAANRYKWFGKKEECYLPSPSIKIKFFD